ncbi:uncharacterized protein LOC126375068 [Pectinophora gossypiella]|uniref:uncharacterized protein LOC126375068 n=1 Tax=Pectinophora gossypiella TaxID=13191 RepID=UPI00214E19AD|nr:uncharacterized protein LOC126375068 [Pectinophora gossypiella]
MFASRFLLICDDPKPLISAVEGRCKISTLRRGSSTVGWQTRYNHDGDRVPVPVNRLYPPFRPEGEEGLLVKTGSLCLKRRGVSGTRSTSVSGVSIMLGRWRPSRKLLA